MCFKPNLPANLLLFFDICKSRGLFVAFLHKFSIDWRDIFQVHSVLQNKKISFISFFCVSTFFYLNNL